MEDKVFCPYCGEEMRYINPNYTLFRGVFKCDKCNSCSPIGEGAFTPEKAKKNAVYAAKHRAEPKNRVLTIEEACGSEELCVFLEIRNLIPIWPVECVIAPDINGVEMSLFNGIQIATYTMETYGTLWRCWLRKPTEGERKAVPWQ